MFHDTTNYEFTDEIPKEKQPDYSWILNKVSDEKGLWGVIEEFLNENKDTWKIKERFINNNGFTILERIK